MRSDIVGRGIPAERITVIPNAVDVGDFRFGDAPDPALRRELGLDGATVLGFAGSFYALRGARPAARRGRACSCRAHPNLRVLLVGGGPQEQALQGAGGSGSGSRIA